MRHREVRQVQTFQFAYEGQYVLSEEGKLEELAMWSSSKKATRYTRQQIMQKWKKEEEREEIKLMIKIIGFANLKERKNLYKKLEENDAEMFPIMQTLWEEMVSEL